VTRLGRGVRLAVVVGLAGALLFEVAARMAPAEAPPDLRALWVAQQQPASILEPDDVIGWRLRAGLDEPLGGVRIQTSSLGARGAEPVAPEVLVLGDGGAFGLGVEQDQTWPQLLAAAVPGEVLNASIPGLSTEQGRRLLPGLLGRLRPATVILALGAEDARRSPLPDQLLLGGALADRSAAVAWLRRRSAYGRARALLDLRQRARERFAAGSARADQLDRDEQAAAAILRGSGPRVPPSTYAANLVEMIERIRAAGARALVIGPALAGPDLEETLAVGRETGALAAYRGAARDAARSALAAYVELSALTTARRRPRAFVQRPLQRDDTDRWRAVGLSDEQRLAFGLEPSYDRKIEFGWPSHATHRVTAQVIVPVLGRPELRLEATDGN